MLLKYFKTLAKKINEYDKLYKKGATNPFLDKNYKNCVIKEKTYIWIEKENE